MQLIEEEWKDIQGMEGVYQVSNLGRVRSLDHIIHYTIKGKPRQRIAKGSLYKTGKSAAVHIPMNNNQDTMFYLDELVITHFTSIYYDEWKIIEHLDGDTSNCALSNLQVIDPFSDEDEIWKDVTGYEGRYKVSNKGRFFYCPIDAVPTGKGGTRHARCSLATPSTGGVNLRDSAGRAKDELISRIVAQEFIQADLQGYNVIHKDGNKLNNCVDNLQVVSINDGYYVKDTINERWQPVVGFEGRYEVSDWGNVRSLCRPEFNHSDSNVLSYRLLMQNDIGGYKTVCIQHSTKLVHRLVAKAFIPNDQNKPEVNHKDRNHSNNKVSNLEWVTKEENIQHALANGWDPGSPRRGKKNSTHWYECMKNAKHETTPEILAHIREGAKKHSKKCRCVDLNMEFDSIAAAARYFHCNPTTITEGIKRGYKTKGHTFEIIQPNAVN